MYDEASSTQPNYSSLGPTYDMEAENAQQPDSYNYIEHTNSTPQAELANPTPPEASKNDFYDAEQHTYAVVNVNKNSKKKTASSATEDPKPTVDAQDFPPCPESGINDASKKGDDFYDAEEHTYSVVNTKSKKKANKKPSEDEGEREEDY